MQNSSKATSQALLISVALACWSSSWYFSRKSQTFPKNIDREAHNITPRSDLIRYFSLGLKRSIADLVWLHTLMESDTHHYLRDDLQSWMYLRFATMVDLDPRFYEAYYFGGLYLMVAKNDLKGAEDILLRGVRQFPENTKLNWLTGYLYAIELNQTDRAIPFLKKIIHKVDRPPMVDNIYVKILSNNFSLEEAFQVALETLKSLDERSHIRPRLLQQVYSLKAMRDIECLERSAINCERLDFFGKPYIQIDGQWSAQSKVLDLRWKKKKAPPE